MRILYFAVSSSVLIGLVLLFRRLFRRQLSPGVIYGLWLLPLIRLLVPFGVGDLPLSGRAWELWNAPYALMEQAVESLMEEESTKGQEISKPSQELTGADAKEQAVKSPGTQVLPDMEPEAAGAESESRVQNPAAENVGIKAAAAAMAGWLAVHPFYLVWLCGSLFLGTYTWISNRKLKRGIRRMDTAESRYSLPVCCSDAVVSPCLFGLFEPCILVNRTVMEDEELYRQVIRHELTHYRQKDHIWTFLRVVMCVIYWWNPFVWAAAVYSREDAELACDSRAVKMLGKRGRKAYGLALLRLLEQADRGLGLMYGATSMSGQGRSFKRRIEGLAEEVPTKKGILLPICLVLTAALLYGCAVPGSGSYVQSGWRTADAEVRPTLEVSTRLQESFQSRLFYTEVYKYGELTEREICVFGNLDTLQKTTAVLLDFVRTEDYECDEVNLIMDDNGVSYERPMELGEAYKGSQVIAPLETKGLAVNPGDDLILLAAYAEKTEDDWSQNQVPCENLMTMSEEERAEAFSENALTILVHLVLSDLPEDELCAMYQKLEVVSEEASSGEIGTGQSAKAGEGGAGQSAKDGGMAGTDAAGDTDAEAFVQRWIDAFIERDGDALVGMMTAEVQQWMRDNDMLGVEGEGNYFGWSSPWPTFGDELYRILSCTEEQAEILYYAGDSTPHLYVWRQILTLEKENGEYKVAADSEEHLETICTAEDFFHAYPDGIIVGTAMDYSTNGLGEYLNNNAKEIDNPYYERYFDPVTAARDLLNLEDGPTGVRIYAEDTTGKTIVHITFLMDGSTVDVEMVQPYGADGIWIPQNAL